MEQRLPLVLVAASGGARMQEGTLSLMQMAKTSAALARFAKEGLLYISVLSNPTTGGVSASFANQADIILAEPGAIIGFAGRRVIEATIRQKAPADFQTAEWVFKHGQIDQIVPRPRLRDTLGQLISLHHVRKLEAVRN
ncbi:Acetyl-coenzyme A carboxylase carboxyl transferase subunit beta [compost metagenome]